MHILRIVKNIKIVEQSQKGEWQIFWGGRASEYALEILIDFCLRDSRY